MRTDFKAQFQLVRRKNKDSFSAQNLLEDLTIF